MPTIKYSTTSFREPGIINEETYNSIKQQLSRNPNFNIDPNAETFSEHFSDLLTALKIAAGYFIIYLVIFGNKSESQVLGVFNFLAGISALTIFISGIYLLLEGPSFSKYIKEKTEYFANLKSAIQQSNSYFEFVKLFYKLL